MAKPTLIQSMTAEAAVSPFRIVKFGATDSAIVPSAAAADSHIGVVDSLGAAVGGRADVILDGIADVELGGAVARGALITADASGRGVAAAPAAGTNNGVIGRALASGVLGDIVPMIVSQGSLQG